MSHEIPSEQYDMVVALIARFHAGVTAAELATHLKPIPSVPATTQCLQRLIKQHRIEAVEGPGEPKYRVAPAAGANLKSQISNFKSEPAAVSAAPGNIPDLKSQTPDAKSQTVAGTPKPPSEVSATPAGTPAGSDLATADATPATVAGTPKPPSARPPGENDASAGTAGESSGNGTAAATGAVQAQAFAETMARAVREVVRDTVLHRVPKSEFAGVAQVQATVLHWNSDETATLIARAREELARLTPQNAGAYGLLPEQVAGWLADASQVHGSLFTVDGSQQSAGGGNRPERPSSHAKVNPLEQQEPSIKPSAKGTSGGNSEGKGGKSENRESGKTGSSERETLDAGANSEGETRNAEDLFPHSVFRLPQLMAALRSQAVWVIGAVAMGIASAFTGVLTAHKEISVAIVAGLSVCGLVWVGVKGGLRGSAGAEVGSDVAPVRDRGSSMHPAAVTARGYNLRRRWPWFAAAGCVALIAAGVITWYLHRNERPSDAAVGEAIVNSLAPLPMRIATLRVTPVAGNSAGTALAYQAVLETTAPLYRRLDTTEYLRAHAAGELAIITAADALLRKYPELEQKVTKDTKGPGSVGADERPETKDQRPVDTSLPPSIPQSLSAPFNLGANAPVLVTTATPTGTSVVANGTVVAWQRNGAWAFTPEQGGVDRSRFAGEPKPAGAWAVDDPADAAKLEALLAEHVAYARKIQAAAAAADAERNRQQQMQAFAKLLTPGTVFSGVVVDPARGDSERIIIELGASAGGATRLTARVRNGGGWTDARAFEGEWAHGADGNSVTVTLRTHSADRIAGAGPWLDEPGDWAMTLQVGADGTAALTRSADGNAKGETRNAENSAIGIPQSAINATLHRLTAAEVTALKAELGRPMADAIAATKAGKVYRGTALARTSDALEPLLLRFTAQEEGGSLLRASVESTSVAGQVRSFRGTVLGNTYRAAGASIRLRSDDSERVAAAAPKSLLGLDTTNNSLTLALRVDGTRLVGEDERFTYEFTIDTGDNRASGANGSAAAGQSTILSPVALAETTALEAGRAYARIAGRWVALPQNNGHEVKKLVQAINGWFAKWKAMETAIAGKQVEATNDIVGELVFDGTDPVPLVPGAEALIVYVGAITPRSDKEIRAYPLLLLEPPIELSPMQKLDRGERYALFSQLVPGVKNFGVRRVDVVIEQPRPTLTVVRPRGPLAPGPYAVECNAQAFEFVAQ